MLTKDILESYIRLIVEGKLSTKVGKTRTSDLQSSFIKQSDDLEDWLNKRKIYQDLLNTAKALGGNVNDNLEQLRRGATVSGTPPALIKPKGKTKIVHQIPQGNLASKISDWMKVANQWEEIEPDEVYQVKQNFLNIHKDTLDDSGNLQKDDPFKIKVTAAPTTPRGVPPAIKSLQWVPWTTASDSEIYDQTPADYSEKIGPGERKLVKEIGAQGPMGQGVSFDMTKDGYKYEIKSITSSSKSVRAAGEGMKLFSKVRKELEDVLIQIKIFVAKYKQVYGSDSMTDKIDLFMSEEEDQILSGAISEARMKKFSSIIQLAVRTIEKKGVNVRSIGIDKRDISIDGVTYTTTDRVYNTILDMIGKNVTSMNANQKNKFLASILKSSAFDDIDDFFDKIEVMLEPVNMFSGVVDGLFIVHQKGYFYIDIQNINNFLEFKKISQGRPEYEFIGPLP